VLLHKENTLPSIRCLCRPQKRNIRKFSAQWTTRHINGTFAMICRLLPFWWVCKRVTQNSVVSYANGIVMPKVFTTARKTGL
jgi:hypothetical protein